MARFAYMSSDSAPSSDPPPDLNALAARVRAGCSDRAVDWGYVYEVLKAVPFDPPSARPDEVDDVAVLLEEAEDSEEEPDCESIALLLEQAAGKLRVR